MQQSHISDAGQISLAGLLLILFRFALGTREAEAGACASTPTVYEGAPGTTPGTAGPFPQAPRAPGININPRSTLSTGGEGVASSRTTISGSMSERPSAAQRIETAQEYMRELNTENAPESVKYLVEYLTNNPEILRDFFQEVQNVVSQGVMNEVTNLTLALSNQERMIETIYKLTSILPALYLLMDNIRGSISAPSSSRPSSSRPASSRPASSLPSELLPPPPRVGTAIPGSTREEGQQERIDAPIEPSIEYDTAPPRRPRPVAGSDQEYDPLHMRARGSQMSSQSHPSVQAMLNSPEGQPNPTSSAERSLMGDSGERVTHSGERVTHSGERVTHSGERVTHSGERVTHSGETVTPEMVTADQNPSPRGSSLPAGPIGGVTHSGERVTHSGETVTHSGETVTHSGETVTPEMVTADQNPSPRGSSLPAGPIGDQSGPEIEVIKNEPDPGSLQVSSSARKRLTPSEEDVLRMTIDEDERRENRGRRKAVYWAGGVSGALLVGAGIRAGVNRLGSAAQGKGALEAPIGPSEPTVKNPFYVFGGSGDSGGSGGSGGGGFPPLDYGNPYFDGLPFYLKLLILAMFLSLLTYFLNALFNSLIRETKKAYRKYKGTPLGFLLAGLLKWLKKILNKITKWLKGWLSKCLDWIKKNPKTTAAIAGLIASIFNWLIPFLDFFKLIFLFIFGKIRLIIFICTTLYLSYPLYARLNRKSILGRVFEDAFGGVLEVKNYALQELNKLNGVIQSLLMVVKAQVPFWAFPLFNIIISIALYSVPLFIFLGLSRRFIQSFLFFVEERKKLKKMNEKKKQFGLVITIDRDGNPVYTSDEEKIRAELMKQEDATKRSREAIMPLAVVLSVFITNLKNVTI